MTDEIVKGAREAYNFLAEKFKDDFTAIHRYKTFRKKCVQNEIKYLYQQTENKTKIYKKDELISWFESGFWDGKVKS